MIEEYKKYYIFLEQLRKSGVTNMFGAEPYLVEAFPELTLADAFEVLCNWMQYYDEIKEKYYPN